jgi:hypothetical protein
MRLCFTGFASATRRRPRLGRLALFAWLLFPIATVLAAEPPPPASPAMPAMDNAMSSAG